MARPFYEAGGVGDGTHHTIEGLADYTPSLDDSGFKPDDQVCIGLDRMANIQRNVQDAIYKKHVRYFHSIQKTLNATKMQGKETAKSKTMHAKVYLHPPPKALLLGSTRPGLPR